jgi:hypothetical protein
MFSRNTVFTYVTLTGVTFTVSTNGALVAGAANMGKRLAQRILTGELAVTTPHRAGGAYGARGAGGVYATMPSKVRSWTIAQAMARDPRDTRKTAPTILAAMAQRYGIEVK